MKIILFVHEKNLYLRSFCTMNIRRMLVPHMFILRKRSIKKKRYQGVLDIAFSFPCVL